MTTPYKYPQHILAISKSFIDSEGYKEGLNSIDLDEFSHKVLPHLVIHQRDQLDGNGYSHFGDNNYLQVLPYFTVTKNVRDVDTNEIISKQTMVYQRVKGQGEARLNGNLSIGFGGHVDLSDVICDENSTIKFTDTIVDSMMREAREELHMADNFTFHTQFTGNILLDYSNDVGKLHIGFIFDFQYDIIEGSDQVLYANEVEATTIGYYPNKGLYSLMVQTDQDPDKAKFEEWSKILIKNLNSADE